MREFNCILVKGDFKSAAAYGENAILLTRTLPPDVELGVGQNPQHPHTIELLSIAVGTKCLLLLRTDTLSATGKYIEAEKSLFSCYTLLCQTPGIGVEHGDTQTYFEDMLNIVLQRGDDATAETLALEKDGGKDTIAFGDVSASLGYIYTRTGKLKNAEPLIAKALDIQEQVFGLHGEKQDDMLKRALEIFSREYHQQQVRHGAEQLSRRIRDKRCHIGAPDSFKGLFGVTSVPTSQPLAPASVKAVQQWSSPLMTAPTPSPSVVEKIPVQSPTPTAFIQLIDLKTEQLRIILDNLNLPQLVAPFESNRVDGTLLDGAESSEDIVDIDRFLIKGIYGKKIFKQLKSWKEDDGQIPTSLLVPSQSPPPD
eukprot:gene30290-39511_t